MQETEGVLEADVGEGGDDGGAPDDGAQDYHDRFLVFHRLHSSHLSSLLSLSLFHYICLQNSQGKDRFTNFSLFSKGSTYVI